STTSGIGVYWRLEKFIRHSESEFLGSVGCTGAIYAIRSALFKPIPPDTILDDLLIPMQIAAQRFRVRFTRQAVAKELRKPDPKWERRRKLRTLAGNYQLIFRHPRWLLPWGHPQWFAFLSHKVLRLCAPWFLLAVYTTNLILAHSGSASSFWSVFLLAQSLTWLTAATGVIVPRLAFPPFSICATFFWLNLQVVLAIFYWLNRDYQRGWASHREGVDHVQSP
ncbi:MAG: glycosyltransferase family 2 protein, partial [Lentisphaerae bacterium]